MYVYPKAQGLIQDFPLRGGGGTGETGGRGRQGDGGREAMSGF